MNETALTPVVATNDDVERISLAIRASEWVGLDTEFHAEHRYRPKLHLVQIYTQDGQIWVLDPHGGPNITHLRHALLAVPWVVHGGTQDMRILVRLLGGLPDRVWDTQIAAGLVSEEFPASFVTLVGRYNSRQLAKTATLSDWSKRPLTKEQIAYAAEDVAALPALWSALQEAFDKRERRAIVAGACDEARLKVVEPPSADLAWRNIGGAGILNGQQAAVLQELAAWRQETAIGNNQPARGVLSDGSLLELARRQPLTLQAMQQNRRLSNGFVKRHSEPVLERMRRAAKRPEWAWPTPVHPASAASRVIAWLDVFARTHGHLNGYAPRLALPLRMREDIALAQPATLEALTVLLGTWRSALFGEPLWEALQGNIGLNLAGPDTSLHQVS